MPEANESIEPFTLLGGILYLNEFELLPGLSANACRNIGRLRRKAVSAHLVGDRKTVISCARQINPPRTQPETASRSPVSANFAA